MPDLEHPDDELLHLALSGELPQADLERVFAHVGACLRCDQRLDELNPELRQYRETCARVDERLKARAWPDIQAALDRYDRQWSSAAAAAVLPMRRTGGSPVPTAWLGALAAAALVCVVLIWPRAVRSELRAETLLEQARQSGSIPSARARLRITTRLGSFLRPAVLGSGGSPSSAEPLRVKFAEARYDWNDPLNPVSYSNWRNQLHRRKEEVSIKRDPATERAEQYSIRTTTDDSALREAVLTLAAPAPSPTGARFVFADQEWVEVVRVPDTSEEIAPREIPVKPAEKLPDVAKSDALEPSLTEREFRVRQAIDRLRAGAGTPIGVEIQPGGEIAVTTYDLNLEQERALEASLARLAGVTVRKAGQDASRSTAAAARQASGAADAILNASETVASRARFLGQLADRFQPEREEQLNASDRKALWEMRARHARELSREIDALAQLLAGNRPADAGGLLHQEAASHDEFSMAALVEAATIVDRLVTGLYAGGAASEDPVTAWPQLTSSLQRVRRFSRAYADLAQRHVEELP